VSPDGRTIVCRGQREFTLWDVSGRPVVADPVPFLPEAGEFDGPILSPNGRLLAVMREVKRKTVWEMKYRSLISLWDIERLRAKVTVPKNP
jgi:hypothetical protein